ncbi:MAG: Rod shape-determining protein MreD [Cyclobacteriaceae bacterium]
MTNRSIVFQVVSFFIYVLVQVLFLRNVVLFDKAFCFIYVGFLLFLPLETNRSLLMLLGFVTGFAVDIFYDSLGIHAAACVFIMFIRNIWINMITPQGGYDVGMVPSIRSNGWQWFFMYITPLIILHHAVLFFTEASGFSLFGFTMMKVLMSSLFTIIALMITQILFYSAKRGL